MSGARPAAIERGVIKPFPRHRHRPFVMKHAGNIAAMGQAAGERYLAHQLKIQRDTMDKRGIAADLAEPEIRALECAIRAALWRMIITPGGAA